MIKILDYKEINSGALVARINVEIPEWDFIINEVTVFKKGNNRWINLPQRTYEEKEEKKYFALNKFSKPERMTKFQEAVLAALDAHLATNEKKPSKQDQEELPF